MAASLTEFFNLYATSIAFPELAFPAIMELKKFHKTCKVKVFSNKLKQLIEQLSKNSDFINAQRKDVEFDPANLTNVRRSQIVSEIHR